MSHSTVAPAEISIARSAPTAGWKFLLLGIGLAFLWLEVINNLRPEWSLNPQYGYGWAVPLLALYLFYFRWLRRPAATPPRHAFAAIALAGVAAVALLPVRVITIANPDWRLISWIIAAIAVVITLTAIYLAGGRSWLRHFWFPVLFFLVAVPWPVQFEQTVVQNLMRADAAITVGLLNFLGTVAVAQGNVIELSTGLVGIDDACTGVRSLQATFMISLFLGEFYSMKPVRRIFLVIAAAGLAFGFNIVRTLILCLLGASKGLVSIHAWHDSAGLSILFACLLGLWAVSLALRPKAAPDNPRPVPAPRGIDRHRWLALALVLWIGIVELASAYWYQVRGPRSQEENSWTVSWPVSAPNYQENSIPEDAQSLLRYNEGGGATWSTSDAQRWTMFYFQWLPGRSAALSVKIHRPDVCLPASGITLQKDNGIKPLNVNGIALPIRSYRFDDGGRALYVFYCYWDNRTSYESIEAATSEDWSSKGRLRAAWMGRRERGSRMLELAVWGCETEAEAKQALRQQLEQIIRPG